MPYTPPARRSPDSSKSSSPSLTRNGSSESTTVRVSGRHSNAHSRHEVNNHHGQQSHHGVHQIRPGTHPDAQNGRPTLPRSKSASYLHRHRRSPSLADNRPKHTSTDVVTHSDGTSTVVSGISILKQTKNLMAAEQLTASPVDVAPEEDRGRQRQLEDLAETLRDTIKVSKRNHSPTGLGNEPPIISINTSSTASLTPEALKIAHSRSSSELNLGSQDQSSSRASPGDSDEEGIEMKRGPLLRKKSGELVKPALRGSSRSRPNSHPGTPTYNKAVHFGDNMEQVHHFWSIDRPIAVSAGSSPVGVNDSDSEYFAADAQSKPPLIEWEIHTKNFPSMTHERRCLPVRVEQIFLAKDSKTLIGIVAVANLAFEKSVVARFTFDYWKTTSEIAAEYSTIKPQRATKDGFDRFQFAIKLSDQANLQNKTLYLCVRYNTAGQEHWDSNNGENFQIDFSRKSSSKHLGAASNKISPEVPRSRHGTNRLPRPKSFPAAGSDDEFSTSSRSPFRLRSSPPLPKDKPNVLSKTNEAPQPQPSGQLSSRYNFVSSLNKSISAANNVLGAKSGLMDVKTPPITSPSATFSASDRGQSNGTPNPPLSMEFRSRPDRHSAEYLHLIKQFCYFGGGKSPDLSSPHAPLALDMDMGLGLSQFDGCADSCTDSSAESNPDSGNTSLSNSPPSPRQRDSVDDGYKSSDSKASGSGRGAASPVSSSSSGSMRGLSPRLLPYNRNPSPILSSGYQEFLQGCLSVQSTKC